MISEFRAARPGGLAWRALILFLGIAGALLLYLLLSPDNIIVALPIMIIVFIFLFVAYLPYRLSYRVKEDRLEIRSPIGGKDIRLGKVERVYLVKVSSALRFRTFGAYLPGFFAWGSFTGDYGSVQAYATGRNVKGVLLELIGGDKVLVTPEDLQGFLNALKLKVVPTPTPIRPQVSLRPRAIMVVLMLLPVLFLSLYLLHIYPQLPEEIPVHWGLKGVSYGPKFYIWIVFSIFAGVAGLFSAIVWYSYPYERTISIALTVVELMILTPLLFIIVFWMAGIP
jgi:hypothetical protein